MTHPPEDPRVRRTLQHLADGREIVFFDRPGAPERVVDDPRPLSALHPAVDIRIDPVLDEPVVIASHRQGRTYHPPVDECPLCPSTDGRHTEVPTDSYQVAVFENQFPSLWHHGRCEVVCFSSRHDGRFADLSPDQVDLVMSAWIDRTVALGGAPEVQQVFLFENRGAEIGVTLGHPHGQIYAYPYLTPRTARMLEVARRHHDENGSVLADSVVARELADNVRIVARNEHWVAFVPYAARWPVEVHLHPRQRVPGLPELSQAQREAFPALYLDVLGRLDRMYNAPLPYIAAWHQAPVREGRDLLGLHLELFSIRRTATKLKFLAGSESAMGAFISDVTPEQVAQRLRDLARP
ncbi:galactose-1-phosphate uridylyltransferase [Spongisporangium articulatum]|uniref:Galactose-1-phosphate uridylyltransferase n=1 Tax=Spongisporangium articulatum TaxID=3362603 RepID=A0ABW8AH18_9ACTN